MTDNININLKTDINQFDYVRQNYIGLKSTYDLFDYNNIDQYNNLLNKNNNINDDFLNDFVHDSNKYNLQNCNFVETNLPKIYENKILTHSNAYSTRKLNSLAPQDDLPEYDNNDLQNDNFNEVDNDLIKFFKLKYTDYQNQMNTFQIDKALKSIFDLLSKTNAYVDTQAPWNLKKTDINRMHVVLFLISNIIIKATIMLYPIINTSSLKVLKIFNFDKSLISFENFETLIDKDITINNPNPIFPRIE